jgi:hypothetical protein
MGKQADRPYIMHGNTALVPHPTLPVTGSRLVQELFERYGGLTRWRTVRHVDVALSAGGLAFALKGQRSALHKLRARVNPARQEVTLDGFPAPGMVGRFSGDRVCIARKDTGAAIERIHPRHHFSDARRMIWWDSLDLLYFTGYALWHYVCFPFVLATPGTVVREVDAGPHTDLRCLEATYPPALHAHSRINRYYLDADLLLRRHHYTAEVIGAFAKAAHLCSGYVDTGDFPVATLRTVLPEIRIDEFGLHRESLGEP